MALASVYLLWSALPVRILRFRLRESWRASRREQRRVSLTKRQREHLRELADVRDESGTRSAYWYPHGAEWRTADALARLGLLIRRYQPSAYELTEAGYAAARLDGSSDE